ncbi:MAG: hypothetical protein ACJAWV_000943 [Flammeovirgaceae bacterium]|jgi:hypothetical protein
MIWQVYYYSCSPKLNAVLVVFQIVLMATPSKTLPKVDFKPFNVWQDLRTLPAIHFYTVV